VNLITGGTGIVGCRLAFDLVKEGLAVRCTKRLNSDVDFVKRVFRFYDPDLGEKIFGKIEWVNADLLDVYQLEKALENVKIVYHTAALVSYHQKDRKKLIDTNVRGTANLVNVCLDSKIESFCHISSVAALGVQKDSEAINEESKWNRSKIHSNYALSKYLAEQEVWRGNGEGLNVSIVNPSVILGPSKPDQSSGSLMNLLRKGISYYPTGATGFVDVRDVSRVCIELQKKEVYGERFLLNAENLNYKKLLDLAAETYNNSKPGIKVGRLALEFARIYELLKSTFSNTPSRITSETLKSSIRKSHYSNQKIKSKLGTEFYPVKDALKYYSGFFN